LKEAAGDLRARAAVFQDEGDRLVEAAAHLRKAADRMDPPAINPEEKSSPQSAAPGPSPAEPESPE
jgi:hypothetical protein